MINKLELSDNLTFNNEFEKPTDQNNLNEEQLSKNFILTNMAKQIALHYPLHEQGTFATQAIIEGKDGNNLLYEMVVTASPNQLSLDEIKEKLREDIPNGK